MAIYVNGKLVAGAGGSSGGGSLNPDDIKDIVTMKGGGKINLVGDLIDNTQPYNIEFRTEDEDPGDGIPKGGVAGQVLVKKSDKDYDVEWTAGGDDSTVIQGVGESVAGKTFVLKNGYSQQAQSGAEIFNDYEERTYKDGLVTYADKGNVSIGKGSHAEGIATTATDYACHAEGWGTYAGSTEEILQNDEYQKFAYGAHAEGFGSEASGIASHAEGQQCIASGSQSHAGGFQSKANGSSSKAFGHSCTASESCSVAFGYSSESKCMGSCSIGFCTSANADTQFCVGGANKISADFTDRFIVGNGTSTISRGNCFRVTDTGTYATGNYNSSGADYAELFEWEDGNPNKEDRCGRFVTLDGNKIKLADSFSDFILGIVSGSPSICGDVNDDQWQGMYVNDVFGRPIWEDKEFPEETIDRINSENPDKIVREVILPARVWKVRKLNPDYDSTQKYIPRSKRPEWDAVGMLGKLVMIDDGTCRVNEYCEPGTNGIATSSIGTTKYRVMERLDDNHIRVLIL